jgi:hypothetical protein
MSDFDIIYQDHLITLVRGDDVVGHVVPTFSGYTPFLFNPESEVFEELASEKSLKDAQRILGDVWTRTFRDAA